MKGGSDAKKTENTRKKDMKRKGRVMMVWRKKIIQQRGKIWSMKGGNGVNEEKIGIQQSRRM